MRGILLLTAFFALALATDPMCLPKPKTKDCSAVAPDTINRWFYSKNKSKCMKGKGGKCLQGTNAFSTQDDCKARCHAVASTEFFPYGLAEGDLAMPHSLDFLSSVIGQPSTVVLAGEACNNMKLSSNGFVTCNGTSDMWWGSLPSNGSRLFAPYWSDVNIGLSGDIYYRVETGADMLIKGRVNLAAALDTDCLESFFPQAMYIFTWDRVSGFGGSISIVNTFQMTILTDGIETFVIYQYDNVNWGNGSLGVKSNPGSCYMHPASSDLPALLALPTTTNVGVPGRLVYKVSDPLGVRDPQCNLLENHCA